MNGKEILEKEKEEKPRVVLEEKVDRFTVKLLNTGLVIVQEEPYKITRKVFDKKLGLRRTVEIPCWRYIKHPSHALVIHINDLSRQLSTINLPKKVKNALERFIELYYRMKR